MIRCDHCEVVSQPSIETLGVSKVIFCENPAEVFYIASNPAFHAFVAGKVEKRWASHARCKLHEIEFWTENCTEEEYITCQIMET